MLSILSMLVAVVMFLLTIPAWVKDRSSRDADLYAIILFAIDSAALLVFVYSLAKLVS